MTTREAHRLIDELPESEVAAVIEFIASRRNADVDLGELLDEEGDELLGELDARERESGAPAGAHSPRLGLGRSSDGLSAAETASEPRVR